MTSTYKIQVFDDGNQEYEQISNIWHITDTVQRGGKLILRNVQDPSIVINTISAWKVLKITPPPPNSDYFFQQ
tara:strand:+ start:5494 stop:5712 length:219 start_codon:yes stop_codon:yes gene_type:complete